MASSPSTSRREPHGQGLGWAPPPIRSAADPDFVKQALSPDGLGATIHYQRQWAFREPSGPAPRLFATATSRTPVHGCKPVELPLNTIVVSNVDNYGPGGEEGRLHNTIEQPAGAWFRSGPPNAKAGVHHFSLRPVRGLRRLRARPSTTPVKVVIAREDAPTSR